MYAANRSARSGRGAKDQRAYPSRPLRRFRANRRTRRADRPTASPRARRKCPCVTLVDRVKFAWAHRRRAQGDPSSPGSDEPFGPRSPAVSRSPLGYAARCRGLDRCGRPPGLAMTRVVSAESPRPCDARSPVPGGAFRERHGDEAEDRNVEAPQTQATLAARPATALRTVGQPCASRQPLDGQREVLNGDRRETPSARRSSRRARDESPGSGDDASPTRWRRSGYALSTRGEHFPCPISATVAPVAPT